jgi:Zn finger protein HypA/HybF involved in hydrogenase expression
MKKCTKCKIYYEKYMLNKFGECPQCQKIKVNIFDNSIKKNKWM